MDGEALFLDNAICMEPLVVCKFHGSGHQAMGTGKFGAVSS
jgi:hypothetical protein